MSKIKPQALVVLTTNRFIPEEAKGTIFNDLEWSLSFISMTDVQYGDNKPWFRLLSLQQCATT